MDKHAWNVLKTEKNGRYLSKTDNRSVWKNNNKSGFQLPTLQKKYQEMQCRNWTENKCTALTSKVYYKSTNAL